MLKGIPSIISPELLKILCEMGHGDRIVIADGNFPAESVGADSRVVRADGHNVPDILDAILRLMPLDASISHPVTLMEVSQGDNTETPVWDIYRDIVASYDERGTDAFTAIERYSFYDAARTSYCIIATGENALYANIMLQKGVITD